MSDDAWRWWPLGHETVRVLARSGHGASETAQVVVPSRSAVARVAARDLVDIGGRPWMAEELTWRAAACRAVAALAPPGSAATHNQQLAPLPHQVVALERSLATNPVRLLLADEVGLGKTIEAGMVISELKARGRVRRVLIVAPKGIQLQWVSEMALHFGEEFVLVGSGGIPVDAGINPWTAFDQVVCSLDSIKPLSARKGWTPERVRNYNSLRLDAVLDAEWDLVVFDEAHHVSGSSEDVARHRVAVHLAAAAPHTLLLSATPHSGKSDAFSRLLGLLDPRFAHGLPLTKEHVAPLVVRSDKRRTTDLRGKPLFQPRTTRLHVVPYGRRNVEQQLYEAITDYVRFGYQRSKAEGRPAIGFLVLLMQRLASSSTAAILAALERRQAAIVTEGTQMQLFPDGAEDWGDLSGEEQVEALQSAMGAAWGDELKEVELLINLARQATTAGLDAKAHELLSLIDTLASQEGDPAMKFVIFTEFTQTQAMLLALLDSSGISAVAINGTMGIHERATIQNEFRERARVLVSTDAGGEGINLQFAHIVVNYDLPWSPSRIEQRIGRVDRIGQSSPVQAINLVMEHSVDARVLEVLETKLAVILAELGADKAGDVLNSADEHAAGLYTAAIAGSDLNDAGAQFAKDTRDAAEDAATFLDLIEPAASRPSIGGGEDPNVWKEKAVLARRATLGSDAAVGPVLSSLPEVSPAEPLPVIAGPIGGLFSLWEVSAATGQRSCEAVFITDSGGMRPDLADRVWDQLLSGVAPMAGERLGQREWEALWDAGWGYAARTDETGDVGAPPPGLTLRLLVRVAE